jgi:His-Xaa-Ser system protein HxsD
MPGDSEKVEPLTVRVSLDLRVYRIAAIKKAAYRVAASCTALFEQIDEVQVQVALQFKPNATESSVSEAVRLFHQEVLDQELREHIAEETRPLRTLILAQAFSRTDLIRRD